MNQQELGRYIQATLDRLEMSQIDLANEVGVSKDVINKLCTGARLPKDAVLQRIATVLGIVIPNVPTHFIPGNGDNPDK